MPKRVIDISYLPNTDATLDPDVVVSPCQLHAHQGDEIEFHISDGGNTELAFENYWADPGDQPGGPQNPFEKPQSMHSLPGVYKVHASASLGAYSYRLKHKKFHVRHCPEIIIQNK
jgi:hypothetical protein